MGRQANPDYILGINQAQWRGKVKTVQNKGKLKNPFSRDYYHEYA